jgi:hypothetical protein
VFEYYCLTGDVDALEAGLDLAEFAKVSLAGLKGDLDIQRGWGRLFQCALRAYQVTRDRSWKAVADRYADSAIQAPNRDPQWGLCSYVSRAFLGFPKHLQPGEKGYLPARLDAYLKDQGITFKVEKQTVVVTDRSGKTWKLWTQPPDFQLEICQKVLARYAEITGSEDARDIVVGLARAAREFHWSPHCKLFPGRPFIGLPAEGKALDWGAWDDAHAKCPDGGAEHSGYNSRFFADVFARAYAFSGDPEFLEWARRAWNVGSKRRYRATSQTTPDDQVAEFANHRAPKGAGVDIRCSARMFYEVPRARSRG